MIIEHLNRYKMTKTK